MSEKEIKKDVDVIDILTPDMAQAKAVKSLGDGVGEKFSGVRVLSNLGSLGEIERLNAKYLIGGELPFFFDYMTAMANRELEMRCSLKRKGRRARDDVVDAVKQHFEHAEGLGARARGFLSG